MTSLRDIYNNCNLPKEETRPNKYQRSLGLWSKSGFFIALKEIRKVNRETKTLYRKLHYFLDGDNEFLQLVQYRKEEKQCKD